jgi:hypothetical protein
MSTIFGTYVHCKQSPTCQFTVAGMYPSDLMRSASSVVSCEPPSRGVGEQQLTGSRSNSMSDRQKSVYSAGMTSTQSESDLLKAYEAALRSED